jgi:uncharacterized protein (TIGR03437 family)
MLKLFSRSALAALALAFPIVTLADVTGTPTLAAGSTLSLDTGAISTSGSGDITWTGTSLTVVGSATDVDLTTASSGAFSGQMGYSEVVQIGQADLSLLKSEYGSDLVTSAITPSANHILVVKTNGGNYAAVLVTAISGSIGLTFDTLGATSKPTGPTVTGISNNYSGISQGLPNYGIAPGSLFVIYGSDLASATNTQEKFPLQTTLNGTSVSVTVNGTTVQPGLYYITPGQLAAVLPSTTPTGTANITVTNGSATSAAFSFQVVESAFGIDTVYGTGAGQAVVTDANYKLIGYSASASPNQTVIIWGSGVGPDTKNDDKTYPAQNLDNLTNIPMTAYIGGIVANIVYRGRSQYPGVDQVVVTIPEGVTPGCNVSIVLVSGGSSVASNFATTAVNPNGGTCSDPNSPYSITSLNGNGTVSFGFLDVSQVVSTSLQSPLFRTSTRVSSGRPFAAKHHLRAAATTATNNDAAGIFESIQGAELGNYGSYETASIGSCVVFQENLSTGSVPTTPFTETGLDAGTITVSGPAGSKTLTSIAELAGFYDAQLSSSFIPSSGGSFTFNGGGGKNVGKFSTTVTLGSPLFTWTNMASTTSVTRSSGVKVTWQGGQSGTYVEISGFSSGNSVGAGFYCLAKQEDLGFTVPSWVTDSLPAGTGDLDVSNISTPHTFTASGLTVGYAYADVDDSVEEIPYN